MRDILFRGKSVNDGNWVQGSLVITTIEPADDTPIKHYHIEDMTIGVFPDAYQSGLSETVDPNTVGQFAGLTDKNGKRIFEGDLIKPFDDEIDKMVVEFHRGQFLLCLYGERGYMTEHGWEESGNYGCFEAEPLSSYGDDVEVIGNIHDNPELLEATT